MADRRISLNKQIEKAGGANFLPVTNAQGEQEYMSKADFLQEVTDDIAALGVDFVIGQSSAGVTLVQADIDADEAIIVLPRLESGAIAPFRRVYVNGNFNSSLTSTLNAPATDTTAYDVSIAGVNGTCEVGDLVEVVVEWKKKPLA